MNILFQETLDALRNINCTLGMFIEFEFSFMGEGEGVGIPLLNVSFNFNIIIIFNNKYKRDYRFKCYI